MEKGNKLPLRRRKQSQWNWCSLSSNPLSLRVVSPESFFSGPVHRVLEEARRREDCCKDGKDPSKIRRERKKRCGKGPGYGLWGGLHETNVHTKSDDVTQDRERPKERKGGQKTQKEEIMAGEEWVSKNPPRDRKGCRLQTTVLHGRLVHNGPLPFELTIHSPFSRAHEPQTHTAVQEVAPPSSQGPGVKRYGGRAVDRRNARLPNQTQELPVWLGPGVSYSTTALPLDLTMCALLKLPRTFRDGPDEYPF